MKTADWIILQQIEQVQRLLIVQGEKLDRIEAILLAQATLVTPELERAVRGVAARAVSIDKKVDDQPPTPQVSAQKRKR